MKSADISNGIPVTKPFSSKTTPKLEVISKETIINGKEARIQCAQIDGQIYGITKGLVTVIGLEDEWYDDVRDPYSVINMLGDSPGFKPDIFTFWQRLPDVEPRFPFHREWEHLAVLPIKSYDHWWNQQIKSRVRGLIRKTEKEGVQVKEVPFDDDFVRGMSVIFNDAPVRQGRRFWHYGKCFGTIKRQFSRFIFRETMLGAYFNGELIGFVMLGNAGRFALTGEILASVKHRDKAVSNALIAKCVEICEREKMPQLVYLYWSDDSLAEFKRRCGFEIVRVPRYFVPFTLRGRLALRVGLHRGWKGAIPAGIKVEIKRVRRIWNEFRCGQT